MGNKTRRKGQKRGVTRRKGGAIDKLPDINERTTLKDFRKKWDVIYISAHGLLLEEPLVVPKDTYILNSIPSTMTCLLSVTDDRLKKFYEEDYEVDFMNFVTNPKETFTSIYSRGRIPTSKANKETSTVTAIYEPADSIYDMLLQFKSHVIPKANFSTKGRTHFIVPGIFRVPIPNYIKVDRNKSIRQVDAQINVLNDIAMKRLLNKVNNDFTKAGGNLLGDIVRQTGKTDFTLSELLRFPVLAPAKDKNLLIVIHACRSSSLPNVNKRRVRAESVNRILHSEERRIGALAPVAAVSGSPVVAAPPAAVLPAAASVVSAPAPAAQPLIKKGFLLPQAKVAPAKAAAPQPLIKKGFLLGPQKP